jgi:hypothetical protein
MVEINIIDTIPFDPHAENFSEMNSIDKNRQDIKTLNRLCAEAQKIARPKFLYKISFIEGRGWNFVILDGVRFTSRVLSVNLSNLHHAFPIIATCGREMEEWSKGIHGILDRYWAHKIKEMAMESAIKKGMEEIHEIYHPGGIAYMSPGSIKDWPLTEQAGLFALLGDKASEIGVELTGHFLMLPAITLSGIMFAAEEGYENCQLCPREYCMNRRSPYEPDLYEKKYGLQQ